MIRPSMQFYPRDWLAHPGLRMCSLAARGLWMDMMSLMHSGEPYGYLTHKGKDILPPVLARLVGVSLAELEGYLHELIDHGVVSQTDTGTFFSGRMVKDEHNRQVRAAGGVKSLDNPNVPPPKDTHTRTRKDILPPDGRTTFAPSPAVAVASASASSSSSVADGCVPEGARAALRSLLGTARNPTAAAHEIKAIADGTRNLKPTPDQLGRAVLDFVANGSEWNAAYFRTFVKRAIDEDAPRSGKAHIADDDADFVKASEKLQKLVDKRDPLHSHTLTQDGWALLDAKERASLKVIGGIERVLTAKSKEWQWVVRDFLKAQRGAAA